MSLLLLFNKATGAYTLTALNGTYAVTGQAATLTVNRVLMATSGMYAVTGRAATIAVGRLLSAGYGVYSIAGYPATISYVGPPTPTTTTEYFIEIRSFTERRRF